MNWWASLTGTRRVDVKDWEGMYVWTGDADADSICGVDWLGLALRLRLEPLLV